MKKLMFLMVGCLVLTGCTGDEATADNEKLKADLTKGGDRNAMSPEQKKNFDEYMKNRGMGGAASAPSGK